MQPQPLMAAADETPPARTRRRRKRAGAEPAEERFLAETIAEGRTVEICLTSGTRLEGRILSFDRHVVLVQGETTDKVYKTAISTIQEARKKSPAKLPLRVAMKTREPGSAPRAAPVIVVKKTRRAPTR